MKVPLSDIIACIHVLGRCCSDASEPLRESLLWPDDANSLHVHEERVRALHQALPLVAFCCRLLGRVQQIDVRVQHLRRRSIAIVSRAHATVAPLHPMTTKTWVRKLSTTRHRFCSPSKVTEGPGAVSTACCCHFRMHGISCLIERQKTYHFYCWGLRAKAERKRLAEGTVMWPVRGVDPFPSNFLADHTPRQPVFPPAVYPDIR